MLKQNRALFFAIMLSVFVTVFLAITFHGGTQAIRAESEKIKKGGELRVAHPAKPRHLNPAIQSGTETGMPGAQLFASLLKVDRNWIYRPYLAKRWEVSKDGLSFVFYLRANATFHDGKPITSADVAFSIFTVKKHHPFSSMLEAVEDVETPDPLTVVIRLNKPHPAMMLVAASPMLPILPKHIYGDGRDILTHPANWKVVGSGPFQLEEANDKKIVLKRFPYFFIPGRPYLDKISFNFMKPELQQISFEVDAVHMIGFASVNEKIGHFTDKDKLVVDYEGYAGVGPLFWLAFNLRKSPFDDLRVRQAFAYAIDRTFLIKALFGENTSEATGPISPGTPFYSDDVEKYEVDIEKANALLDEAGYTRDAKGIRFSTTIYPVPSSSVDGMKMASYLRIDLLRKIGVNVEIAYSDSFGVWAKSVADGEFSLALDAVFNWGDPVIGVHRTYSSKNIRKGIIWSNTQGYENFEVDRLMERAGQEMDFQKRKELYEKFQRIVAVDLPVYWLLKLPYATIYNRNLEGVDKSIWGTMFPYDEIRWKDSSNSR